jgi:hypothetical protein
MHPEELGHERDPVEADTGFLPSELPATEVDPDRKSEKSMRRHY